MASDAESLAELLRSSDATLVVTGAGISTEVGIPDYRGPHGVWKTQRPVEFSEFVSLESRRIDYWDQKVASAETITAARPGSVHLACVAWQQADRLEAIVTQNVDGLHGLAGSHPSAVVEVHGTARQAGCLECGERTDILEALAEFEASRTPPRCHCGGLLKPATISFGQALDPLVVQRAVDAADRCDLVIALGTTLSVYPAADIPMHAARRGVPYAIVNRGRTEHDRSIHLTLRIDGDVGTVFSEAVDLALSS